MARKRKDVAGQGRTQAVRIACIVEGEGEMEALPILIRRIAKEQQFLQAPQIIPILASRGDFGPKGRSKVVGLVQLAMLTRLTSATAK